MLQSLYNRERDNVHIDYKPNLAERVVTVEIDGIRKKVVELVETPVDQFSDFTAYDFELQTLIETGEINNLKAFGVQSTSILDAFDKLSNNSIPVNEN